MEFYVRNEIFNYKINKSQIQFTLKNVLLSEFPFHGIESNDFILVGSCRFFPLQSRSNLIEVERIHSGGK